MKKRAVILWSVALFAAAYGLYEVKWKVRELRNQNLLTEAEIIAEKQAMEVLSAEWTYQTRAERIEKLAQKHLPGMTPGNGAQMAEMGEFPPPAIVKDAEKSSAPLTYSSFSLHKP